MNNIPYSKVSMGDLSKPFSSGVGCQVTTLESVLEAVCSILLECELDAYD
jgi:hypothetical protein